MPGRILCLALDVIVGATISTAISAAIRPVTTAGRIATAIGTSAITYVAAPYIHDASVRALRGSGIDVAD